MPRFESKIRSSESSWVLYLRMLGAITTLCIPATTFLHEVHCELSSEPTHWTAALLLVVLSASCFACLAWGKHSRFAALLHFLSATILAVCLATLDLCDAHRGFFIALIVINLTACWLFMRRASHWASSGAAEESRDAE